jgi:hypothetical protein
MPDRLQPLTPYVPPPHSWLEDPNITRGRALRVAAKNVSQRGYQILALLAERGPLCIFEIAAALSNAGILPASSSPSPIFPHQISGRFIALVEAGLIEKTGHRRPTPTGCSAEVYTITLAGLAVHQEHSNHLRTGGER